MSFPASVRHCDSNPRPLNQETSPKTTKPGLPPNTELDLTYW